MNVIKMITFRYKNACLLAVLLSCFSSWAFALAPKLDQPPNSRVSVISNWMEVNGVASHIRQFNSKMSVERVIRFYKNRWDNGKKQQDYGISESLPPWTIISIIKSGYLLTVQATKEGARGSMGYLSISKLSDMEDEPKLGRGFPKLKGTHVLNDIDSDDGYKDSRTLVLFNKKSVKSNVSYYRNYYTAQGWSMDMDGPLFNGRQHTLRFSRGNKHVTLAIISQDRGTAITAQVVDEGIL